MVGVLAVVGLTIVGGALCACWVVAAIATARRRQIQAFAVAKREFRFQREHLEARFVTLASRRNAAQGFLWGDCEFADEVSFARDRGSGELRALVGVTIFFEPSQESHLGRLRSMGRTASVLAATAVFRYVGDKWQSEGHAVFNLDPGETMRRFGHELDAVE